MFLLVGHGYWGKNIAKTFNTDLYGICDSNIKILETVSNEYPYVKLFSNFNEALEDSNITAVIIASKASTHYELAKKAIMKDKHVWIEKPACINIRDIENLIELSTQKQVKVFVDHIMCHDSAINHIKDHIDIIGKVAYFESYRLHQGIFQPDVDIVHDLAVHDLSIIDYLFPGIELIEKNIIKNRHVNFLADHAVLNFKFDNGLRATITCSWVSPIKQRQILIGGSKGAFHYFDGNVDFIKLHDNISENYSPVNCLQKEKLNIEHLPGLNNAKRSFENMIYKDSIEITNLYQSKRIQQWLE